MATRVLYVRNISGYASHCIHILDNTKFHEIILKQFLSRKYKTAMKNSDAVTVEGKIALITGAARGIGRACALAFAEAGADIALGLRDENADNSLIKEIEAMGRKVLPLQMNVSRMSEIQTSIAQVEKYYGRIDIVVNNAGIAPENLAENVTEEDFDYTLSVNLKGTFFVSQAAGRLMIKQQFGRIINLSSQAGFIALPGESVYCMTKAGIAHLTKCLGVEWAKYNITVNAVAPTFIYTPGTEDYLANDDIKKQVLSKIPLGRIGEPKDVANAVLEGADAVMLSAETATGKHPSLVVETMRRIILEVEKTEYRYNREEDLKPLAHSPSFLSDAICYNACKIARDVSADALIGMTQSGYTAFMLSSYRPKSPMYIFSKERTLINQLSLSWGVRAFYYAEEESLDDILNDQIKILKERGFIKSGDVVINTGSTPVAQHLPTNLIKVTRID